MADDWHVAAHVDPEEVLDLSAPAQTVLAGLVADWCWVVLGRGPTLFALTRKELADLIGAHRVAGAETRPDPAQLSMRDLLGAADFPPALVVDRDVWARELAGLSAGIGGGTRLRIIARVAGAPLVIWAHREYSLIDRAGVDTVRVLPRGTMPGVVIPDLGIATERVFSEREQLRKGAGSLPERPRSPLPAPRALPPQEAMEPIPVSGASHHADVGSSADYQAATDFPESPFHPEDAVAVGYRATDEPAAGQIEADAGSPRPPGAPEDASARRPAVQDDAAPARWVNAVLEDYPAKEPLVVAETYTLAISIDARQLQSAGAVGAVVADPLTRDADNALLLTVSVSSNDFTIDAPERHLKIGKDGLSAGKARFDIVPIRAGLGRLTAILHRDNNFVQQLDISLQVGPGVAEPAGVVSTGRPVAASADLSRRDIGLSIQPSPAGGFDCIVWGATSANVKLPISADELDAEIDVARMALLSVVTAKAKDGTRPFQGGDAIDVPVRDAALKAIALAGYTLFQKLFFHPAADRQCQALGDWLVAETNQAQEGFTLQIVARDFPVPWAMLYLAPEWKDDSIDFERFLGMKLVVEQIPLRNDQFGRDTRIPADPGGLSVSLNLNTDIDVQMNAGIVAAQETYWQQAVAACPAIRLRRRTMASELVDALNDAATDDQIVYFFCHAESVGLRGGGPGSSNLTLSGNGSLDLADLTVRASSRHKLSGAPLVFINACESGKLSPLFYNGFVPYFMSKGARGVIGTECKVPGRFAEAWAGKFFDAFLAGRPLGETMRLLRRNFYLADGNPLGLLYGLHCSADTRIDPLPPRQTA